ncbi:unnamed protein product, partial [marine sediment metagenome]
YQLINRVGPIEYSGFLLKKYSSDGRPVFTKHLKLVPTEAPLGTTFSKRRGTLFVYGRGKPKDKPGMALIAEIDSSGTILWENYYDHSGPHSEGWSYFGFDANENIYLTGVSALGHSQGNIIYSRFCNGPCIEIIHESNNSDATICLGDSVKLDATISGAKFHWEPQHGLESADTQSPFAMPTTSTTYSLFIGEPSSIDQYLVDDLKVNVEPCGNYKISFPTVISPESSGVENIFSPKYIDGSVSYYRLEILNSGG